MRVLFSVLGSFDSEDFFDNSVEVVEKVTVKKSRKGRAKKSRLANLKDQDSEVVKKVNPITAVGTAISTDGSNGTDESKNGSSKTGSSKNGSKKVRGPRLQFVRETLLVFRQPQTSVARA